MYMSSESTITLRSAPSLASPLHSCNPSFPSPRCSQESDSGSPQVSAAAAAAAACCMHMHREGIKHGCSTVTAPEYGNCRRLYVSSLCLYCVLNVRVGECGNQRRAHCGNARSGEIEKRQNGNRNRHYKRHPVLR